MKNNRIIFNLVLFLQLVGSLNINANTILFSDKTVCSYDNSVTLEGWYESGTTNKPWNKIDLIRFRYPNSSNSYSSYGTSGPVEYGNGNINFQSIYDNNTKWNDYTQSNYATSSRVQNGVYFFLIEYVSIALGVETVQQVCRVEVTGNRKIATNIPSLLCPSEDYNVITSPEAGVLSGLSIGNDLTYNSGANLLSVIDDNYAGQQYIDVTENINGCTLTKSFVHTITTRPLLNWVSIFPSGILDSDSPINISSYAIDTFANFPVSYSGPGINGNDFDPHFAGVGTHTITATSVSTSGCSSFDTTSVTVSQDPNSLPIPEIDGNGSAYYPTAYYVNGTPVHYFNFYSVCAGSSVPFWVLNTPPSGIDSLVWYYSENNQIQEIGRTKYNQVFNVPIPETGVARKDYLYVSYLNNLGQEGPSKSILMEVNTSSFNSLIDDTICGENNQVVIPDTTNLGLIQNSQYSTLYPTSSNFMTTLAETRKYVWKDMSGNIIDTTHVFNRDLLSQKYEYVSVEEITYLPNSKFVDGIDNLNPYVDNREFCSYTDTIALVHAPEVSFNALGQSTLNYGDVVPFINNSTYTDWAEFNFGDGSQFYSTAIFGDTILHYMNQMGNYDVLCVAKDSFNCQSDSLYIGMFYVEDWTGLEESEIVNDLNLYPNPFLDQTTLSINTKESCNSQIKVVDITGKVVYLKSQMLGVGENKILLNFNNISSGNYILYLEIDEFIITSKIVKQ